MPLPHEACTVSVADGVETHACPPCPCGIALGFTLTLNYDEAVNDQQRQLKLAAVDGLQCGDGFHQAALPSVQEARDGEGSA